MEVPKRIVKSGVWLMTIRFGLATTTEWRKSTLHGPKLTWLFIHVPK